MSDLTRPFASDVLTTQPHLATCGQNRFQHLTHFHVSKHLTDRATYAIPDDRQDFEQDNFIAR